MTNIITKLEHTIDKLMTVEIVQSTDKLNNDENNTFENKTNHNKFFITDIIENNYDAFLYKKWTLTNVPDNFTLMCINMFLSKGQHQKTLFILRNIRLSNGVFKNFQYAPLSNFEISGMDFLTRNIDQAKKRNHLDLPIYNLAYFYTYNTSNNDIFIYVFLKTTVSSKYLCDIKYRIALKIACCISPLLQYIPEKPDGNELFSSTIYKASLNFLYNENSSNDSQDIKTHLFIVELTKQ